MMNNFGVLFNISNTAAFECNGHLNFSPGVIYWLSVDNVSDSRCGGETCFAAWHHNPNNSYPRVNFTRCVTYFQVHVFWGQHVLSLKTLLLVCASSVLLSPGMIYFFSTIKSQRKEKAPPCWKDHELTICYAACWIAMILHASCFKYLLPIGCCFHVCVREPFLPLIKNMDWYFVHMGQFHWGRCRALYKQILYLYAP